MKPETRLKRFLEKYWKNKGIDEGFSLWIDHKTDIWFLIGFDINHKMFILNKVESGDNLERVKKLFPGFDFELNDNEYNNVEFFPGSKNSVNVMFMKEKGKNIKVPGIGGIYGFD